MTLDQIRLILDDVSYLDWEFCIVPVREAGPFFLRVQFTDRGNQWKGRKWLISAHATRSEIVQTALKAVLAAVEHEARESFTYQRRAIFGPHFNIDRLAELCDHPRALDPRS